jgi:hypothetical protein
MASPVTFRQHWRAEVLEKPPLIAPARQFVYPRQVAGEEDALRRGALQVIVHPGAGPVFLATCARGFADPRMPTGVYACPNPQKMCAVAGGYAYIIDTNAPDRSEQIPLRPVVEVRPLVERLLLVFVGFHSIVAWGTSGLAWQTRRLSWEGVRITEVQGDTLRGFGWNMMTDREVEFTVDLRSGAHTGGGFQR